MFSNYKEAPEEELWWCNHHRRRATHIGPHGNHCCDPKLGSIMIPCNTVELTGIAEIIEQ